MSIWISCTNIVLYNFSFSTNVRQQYCLRRMINQQERFEIKAFVRFLDADGIPKDMTVEYWFKKRCEHHLNSGDYFTPKVEKTKMEVIDEGDDSKKSYKRLQGK